MTLLRSKAARDVAQFVVLMAIWGGVGLSFGIIWQGVAMATTGILTLAIHLLKAPLARTRVRCAGVLIYVGAAIIRREELRAGLLPLNSLEPREPWL